MEKKITNNQVKDWSGKGAEAEIIRVLCPHCKKNYMQKSSRFPCGGDRWECQDCVYLYSDQWFNQFRQFEHLVVRKGESEDKAERFRVK